MDLGNSVQLTPDQIASAQPAATTPATPAPQVGGQIKLTPDQIAAAKPVQTDPLHDFTAEQLAALEKQDPEHFNLIQNYLPRTELQQVPGMNQKIADAYHITRQTPLLDTFAPGNGALERTGGALRQGAGAVWDLAKGAAHTVSNLAQAGATVLTSPVYAAAFGDETASGMLTQAERQFREQGAAAEKGVGELGKQIEHGAHAGARLIGAEKPLTQYTPEERVSELFSAMRNAKKLGEISAGRGPISQTVFGSESAQVAPGVAVRPESVNGLLDPVSWELMGGAFKGAGALVPKAVSETAGNIAAGAGNIAAKVGGQALETASDLTGLGARAVATVAPASAAAIGAIKGTALHGPAGLVTGAGLGYKAGQAIAEGARNIAKKAEITSGIGEQIAGKIPVASPYAQLGKDVLQSAPVAAGEVAKGAAFDLGLAAASSEEAPAERSGIGIGTAFGLLGAGKTLGQRVLSGQIIAPREYGSKTSVPPSGQFPALDSVNQASIAGSDPGTIAHINALKLFARGVDPNAEVFFGKDQNALESALKQSGMSDTDAKNYSNAEGFFTTSLPGADGNPKRIIVVRNPDAAPHEAFHAVQDVLGEQGNQAVDSIIKQNYGPEWDAIGSDYATNLVGPADVAQKGWRASILDRSGWGAAEAADKQYRDTFNRLSAETGAVPTPETVKSMIDTRTPWPQVLSPEESNAVADKYIARELAAENFDAVFKHSGNEGLTGNQKAPVISRLSNVVANLVSSLGGEPLAGRTSDIRQYPLKYEAAKGVTEAARAARAGNPAVEPKITTAGPRPAIGLPVTPAEQQNAADEAKKIAAEAPATPPTPRPGEPPTTAGTKSPRELLGALAEAIAARSGVKINYSSAPGEPAAAITSTRPIRRGIIEAFRSMPESARALWEKNFFPERVIKTKSGYQVLGWAPEVFASNAHKLAQTLVDLGNVQSPYELDPKSRSFSPAGWQELYNDVSKFVGNQMAGKTGAGEKLVVPASVTEKGFTAPPISGGEGKLDQRKADFINMLYNFKLPETPRITSGKLPLNMAGQRVSEATQPGRVSSPVEPKLPYTGNAAQALGIEGQSINEVNPFRSEVEQAAKNSGVKMPSMVEAIQRLDLNHIKEVAVAPELSQFRGNTLTLTAGFQPKTQAGKDLESRGFVIERSALGKGDLLQYQVLDKSGNEIANMKVGVGPTSAHVESVYTDPKLRDTGIANTLYREMATDLQEKGISSLTGEVIHPAPAKIRAELFGPMRVTPEGNSLHVESQIPLTAQFSPAAAMDSMKSEETWDALKNYKGKYGGGVTGWAFDVGASAKTPEDVKSFRDTNELYATMGREAMKNKDYDAAAQLFTKAQVAREAFEVATGQKIDGTPGASGGVEMLRRKDPNYVPPVLAKPELAGQAQPKSNPDVAKISEDYKKENEIKSPAPRTVPLNQEIAKDVADYYDQAKSEPANPAVLNSYDALAKETIDQYNAITKAGYKIEPWTKEGEPYPNSAAMTADVRENKHLFFKPTGSDIKGENLMLRPSGIKDFNVNDVFRAVHDFFGHAKEGNQFGPQGELNAWQEHSSMYSPEAQGALAAETLAQNSWVNFGQHLRDASGNVPLKGTPEFKPLAERPFAEQKNIVIPPELIDLAHTQTPIEDARNTRQFVQTLGQAMPKKAAAAPKEDAFKLKPASSGFSKAWILPDGTPVQLGGQWHHEWLAENPDVAKKYGIKKATTEEDTSRADALAKGFARINYDARTGTVTVEAREKDLPGLRPSLEKFMQANLPQLDRAQFYLFNDKVNQVADSGSATLFDKPKAERMAAIPFLSAPGDITETSPQATPGALSEQGAPGAVPKRGKIAGQFQAKREQRPEQQSLEGIGGKEPLSTMAIANMTKDEISAHYPEAVIERRKFEPIPSNIIDSPLAKAAGSEDKAVDAYARKLVEFAREKENTPEYKAGQKWYRDFVPQLKKEFGKDSTVFAELLAATSPNTGVTTNFGYAYDALQGLKSGRFNKLIPKFEEGLRKIADDSWEPWLRREVKSGNATGETPAAFLARWIEKYNLKPTQSNGSLYGQHSVPVLSVFARQWMDRNTGPKTRTFVSNLLGTGHDATIDVWADRTMRRLGYEGFNDRWRILPQNSTGVSDADFYFSQKAFRKAASELGMNADDLQGALWFAEKQHWADNGWGRLDLGSFQNEMKKLPLLKAGVQQRLNTTAAKSKVNPLTAGELGISVEPRKMK
jgi:hypothetical protein